MRWRPARCIFRRGAGVPDLRDYQQSGLRDVAAAIREGHRRIIMVAPTGAGKSVCIAAMVRSVRSALAIAHRQELIDQLYDHFTLPEPEGLGLEAGVLMAKDPREDRAKKLQVASIQTLVRRPPLDPPPQLIIIDEAHHATSEGYQKVLAHYPNAICIGPSATPFRTDGRGLGSAGFTKIVTVTTPDKLIASSHLVPPRVFGVDPPDLSGISKKAGDYDQVELAAAVIPAVGQVVRAWERHARVSAFSPGPQTLVFAVNVQHSKLLVEGFSARGTPAEHVDAETPKDERKAIFARLRSGETRIVSNVGIVTEGFDCPSVECCLMARPTMSLGLYLQMIGRALRPHPGKTHALVVDCAGNVQRHGWPTRDLSASYTLDGNVTPKGTRVPGCRRCPECFAVFDAAQPWPCPSCGFQPQVRQMRMLDKHLQTRELRRDEVRDPPTESEQFGYFAYLYGQAIMKKYALGWVSIRFRVRFGRHAPAEFWHKVKASRRASG